MLYVIYKLNVTLSSIAAAFSAIIIVAALVFPDTMLGMTLASATRSPGQCCHEYFLIRWRDGLGRWWANCVQIELMIETGVPS